MSDFLTDYTLSGPRRAPKTYEQLMTELDIMIKAKGLLYSEFGYQTGCKPDQLTIFKLCDICYDLRKFYKKNKIPLALSQQDPEYLCVNHKESLKR